MIIQKIIFPLDELLGIEELYFHQVNLNSPFIYDKEVFYLEKNSIIDFESYFNSFSVGKWKRYTNLKSVNLSLLFCGRIEVSLFHKEKKQFGTIEKIYKVYDLNSNDFKKVSLPFSDKLPEKGSFTFVIRCLSEKATIKNLYYETEEGYEYNNINIAIDICTFKREKYVINNIDKMKKKMNDKESPIFNHLKIYIVDNGQTLNIDELEDENIKVYKNINAGGVAGFTRGMIEVLENKNIEKTSHILLMDDDIVLDPEIIERTYLFLLFVKKEYKESFIGGAMLRLDNPVIQHESGGYMHDNNYVMIKNFYDLRNKTCVLDNEICEGAEIAAWWYCCIPMSFIKFDNLPLPIFFHKDDMEYSKRNSKELILLNGIAVWHQPFEGKSSSHIKYYDCRNLFILAALQFTDKEYGKKDMLSYIKGQVKWHMATYRYKEAKLILKGVEDYFKGVSWLKEVDAEKQLKELIKNGYKKEKINNLEMKYDEEEYGKYFSFRETRKGIILKKLLLNGYLLPKNKKKNIVVPAFYPYPYYFFRANKVLNFESSDQLGFVTQKSYIEAFKVMFQYFKIRIKILFNYSKVKKQYKNREKELTNITFWKKYLKIS